MSHIIRKSVCFVVCIYAKTSTVQLARGLSVAYVHSKTKQYKYSYSKSEISNHDPPSVQTGLCITRPKMWDYFCLMVFFRDVQKNHYEWIKDSRDKTNKKAS